MTYSIKEIYYTLQGEGAYTGQPAVFCRFTGCNLWSGREEDRHKAICQFCDTDFIGTDGQHGGSYTNTLLIEKIRLLWPDDSLQPFVVFTGGEPLLQLDQELINSLKANHILIAVESNGTIIAPAGIDWLCISPKAGSILKQRQGQELKLVYPQKDINPEDYINLDFQHFFLQPCDNASLQQNTQAAIDYCLAHPQWRLSLQTHKMIGID